MSLTSNADAPSLFGYARPIPAPASPRYPGAGATVIPALFMAPSSPRRCSLPAGDDRAGVAHPLSFRRGLPGDEAHNGFRHSPPHEFRRLLFRGAPYLADQDHRVGIRILLEKRENIDERGPDDRVAADPDAGGLPDPAGGSCSTAS
jgi:hypothetical protein